MKKLIIIVLLILVAVIAFSVLTDKSSEQDNMAVTEVENSKETTLTFEIESQTKPCVGVGPMDCMVVNDKFFYDKIEGFEFEAGYKYTLSVLRTERDIVDVPADANIYTYKLLEVISKTEDNTTQAEAVTPMLRYSPEGTTWQYDGGVITFADGKYNMDFGCNVINGEFSVDRTTLSFTAPISTRKACPEEIATKETNFAQMIIAMDTYSENEEVAKLTGGDQEMLFIAVE